MVVCQEHDIGRYLDIKNYYPTDRYKSIKYPQRVELRQRAFEKVKKIEKFCRKFRADAVLIDKVGKPFILETKIGLSSETDCEYAVLQSLLYANKIILPVFEGNVIFRSEEFLDLLSSAHWFVRNYEKEYEYPTLGEKHRFFFGLEKVKKPLIVPGVIFALAEPKNLALSRLIKACERVRCNNFIKYCEYFKQLPARNHRLRLLELENNWSILQKIQFSYLLVNFSLLQQTIGKPLDLLR